MSKQGFYTRQPGTIVSVRAGNEDHGVQTVWVHVDFGGSQQGFGGVVLGKDEDNPLFRSFVTDLCATFSVEKFEDLKGKKCCALRCFDNWGAEIEGLESADTDRRFTLTAWRKKTFKLKDVRTPLERELINAHRRVAQLERSVADEKRRVATISDEYTPWD